MDIVEPVAVFTTLCGRNMACVTICFLILICHSADVSAVTAESEYYKADTCYKTLSKSTAKQKYRHNWLNCIEKFQDGYNHDPSGPWAAAGLFMCGKIYYELSIHSGLSSDLREARDIFERIIKRFPESRYKSRSEKELRIIAAKIGPNEKVPEAAADSDSLTTLIRENVSSSSNLPAPAGNLTTVQGLRYWSNSQFTRVAIDADQETTFAHKYLRADPSSGKPHRLFVDLTHSRVGVNLQEFMPINDELLISARAGQNTPDQVRVVVDIKSYETYKVYALKNPFRILIDVWGENSAATSRAVASQTPSGEGGKLGTSALARQLALGVRRIIVDPGHGGKDFGAPGYLKGVHEKDVALEISKKLAEKIRKERGCEAIHTRTTYRYLTLEERTSSANTKNADLFISVHTNSHRDKRAFGIETYFLNLATDNDAILVAARENATSEKNISDLQSILNDLMQNAKVNESSRLAGHVQTSLCTGLKDSKYTNIKSKGVKQAPFYVLLGAQMPAILVETSFISNKEECKRLVNPKYQDALVESITSGVKRYIREINPTALFGGRRNQG
jgi:N-acetylmuramoyl-L-alanine amidase